MTYNEAYSKIITAYFKDEIQPFSERFCFCGTLSPNENWSRNSKIQAPILDSYPYTIQEYGRMERALFNELSNIEYLEIGWVIRPNNYEINEEELFLGMSAALDVLKQIHIERGEVVENIKLTKRELCNTYS